MEWGVVVAANHEAEWLLPWWWRCYSSHHKEAVAFIDFGMSPSAAAWCKQRGIVIPYTGPTDFVVSPEVIEEKRQKKWEQLYGKKVWRSRNSWFKKPWAMLQTPFKKSVWMDLDCEVCQPIDAIFQGLESAMLGAVRVETRGHYNSGVIVFDQESTLLQAWADACLTKNKLVIGDENLLSNLIRQKKYLFKEISPVYNWVMGWGYHQDLKIAHWVANWGKLMIETTGGIQSLTNAVNREEKMRFFLGE